GRQRPRAFDEVDSGGLVHASPRAFLDCWSMIRTRRAALAQSVKRFSEKHALGLDPRDHAQTKSFIVRAGGWWPIRPNRSSRTPHRTVMPQRGGGRGMAGVGTGN